MRRRLLRALDKVLQVHCPHHGRFCRGLSCCCRDRDWKGL